jgi:hypothetical protein
MFDLGSIWTRTDLFAEAFCNAEGTPGYSHIQRGVVWDMEGEQAFWLYLATIPSSGLVVTVYRQQGHGRGG